MAFDLADYCTTVGDTWRRPYGFRNPYGNNYGAYYPFNYSSYISKDEYVKSYKPKNICENIIYTAGSLIALIGGGLLLKKNGKTLVKYLKPKTYTDILKNIFKRTPKAPKVEQATTKIPQIATEGQNVKKSFWSKIKGLFKRKPKSSEAEQVVAETQQITAEGQNIKKGFWSKIKGIFKRKTKSPEAEQVVSETPQITAEGQNVKKGFWGKIKGIFKRKPEDSAPPKLKPKEIFTDKPKAKAEQKDGFLRRLFSRKPVNETPPRVTIDFTEGQPPQKTNSLKLKLMDLGCKTSVFLRKFFPF